MDKGRNWDRQGRSLGNMTRPEIGHENNMVRGSIVSQGSGKVVCALRQGSHGAGRVAPGVIDEPCSILFYLDDYKEVF